MKNAALTDSGPIVALFNRSDRFHLPVLEFLKKNKIPLITTWPVITEVTYLISFSVDAQMDFLEWVTRGSIGIVDLTLEDIKYIQHRMKKYSDLPMDLADASLMAIAEKREIFKIVSIDSDFSIYRTLKGKSLTNLLKP